MAIWLKMIDGGWIFVRRSSYSLRPKLAHEELRLK
jgi:hypothetical protein